MSRIVTNTSANMVYKNYTRNESALSSSMEKLATGLRVNRGADDPAGLAISETLRAQIKGTDAAVDVLASASNFVNVADGYLQTVNDILGRMNDLSVRMGDGTLTTSDKSNIASEFNALKGEITNLQSEAKFNTVAIFGAARTFTVDANGTAFTVSANGLASLSATATNITTLAATDDGSSQITEIQSAIASIATQRAQLGADQSQLNFKSTALQNYGENVAAAESRIRNVDVAKESANLARNQILVQASTAMLAQANSSTQNVLQLLR